MEKYYIPDYQREYSWDQEQLDDFWIDLNQIVDKEMDQHFFGQVVIHSNNGGKEKYIIDGQQRTITSIIFLALIRNMLRSLKKADGSEYQDAEDDASDIQVKYIGRISETKDRRQLILSKMDRDFFKNYIQSQNLNKRMDSFDSKIPSNKRIKVAYEFLERKMEDKVAKANDVTEKYNIISDYKDCFINKFKVMHVETDDINEAFVIFETLNDRGKSLETADLLKNHIFRSAGNNLDSVKNEWLEIVENLEDIDVTKYIRYYWNSRFGFARKKDLYKLLRAKITNSNEAKNICDDLYSLSSCYVSLVKPNEGDYFSKEIKEILKNISTLNATSFYPIVLSIVSREISDTDTLKILKAIEILVLRNFVVSGLVANKYEMKFSEIARNIFAEKITPNEAVKKIAELIIDDDEFKNNFSTFTVKNSPVIRYLLKNINNYQYTGEMIVNSDNAKVNIEHILPKKFEKWGLDSEEAEPYVWRLGNLTLLSGRYNRRISNDTFDKKKKIYKSSEIKMTRDLTKIDNWNYSEIDKRQKEMSVIAVKIWNISKVNKQ